MIAVNEKGVSISQPLCVRIIKHNEAYRLTKIDDAMEFDKNGLKRFFVYLGNDKIGEGSVIHLSCVFPPVKYGHLSFAKDNVASYQTSSV